MKRNDRQDVDAVLKEHSMVFYIKTRVKGKRLEHLKL